MSSLFFWLARISVVEILQVIEIFKKKKNSPKKIRALIGLKSCFYYSRSTELARAVDVMMARAKRIYILIVKVNKLFSFFS